MTRIVPLVVLIAILFGCQSNSYIIPEDKLVDVLVDIHLVEGVTNTDIRRFISAEERDKALDHIFVMHQMDRARFDSTMHYYALQDERFDKLYDKVIQKLILIETEVKAGAFDRGNLYLTKEFIESHFKEDSLLKDSAYREFWWEKRQYDLPYISPEGSGEFELYIGDSIRGKAILLRAEIKLYPDDCSENPRMVLGAQYRNKMNDEVSVFIVKDSLSRMYQLYLPISDTVIVERIKGALVDHDECLANKHAEIRRIRMYEIIDSGNPRMKPPKLLFNQ